MNLKMYRTPISKANSRRLAWWMRRDKLNTLSEGSMQRRAFTLVELLVVLAVIGLLVGLLLPAVQAVREAARRVQCTNNLKQLALGFHLHHDAHQRLPPLTASGCCWGTWAVAILPFIEQQNLFNQYQNYGGSDTVNTQYPAPSPPGLFPRYAGNPLITSTRISILTCSSDVTSAWQDLTSHNYAAMTGNGTSSSYLGDGPAPVPPGYRALPGMFDPRIVENTLPVSDPPVKDRRRVRFADVVDGLSSTVIAGEVLRGFEDDLRGFLWWGNTSGCSTYFPPNTSEPDHLLSHCVNRPAANLPCAVNSVYVNSLRSRHRNGASAALGDGSVQFISNSIDRTTWQNMGSMADGLPITID